MRRGAKPAKAKVEAKPPVARKSLKSADSRVHDLEKRLAEAQKREAEAQKREAEALERQTATAEVLRVISSSPTNAQPVFDVIAANAMRVCGAFGSGVLRVEGDMLQLAAVSAGSPEWMEAARAMYPQPVGGRSIGSRVVLERRVIQLTDIEHHPEAGPGAVKLARTAGYRTVLMVPMLQAGQVVGVIIAVRKEPTPFPPRQVELLQTFADQAVIAVENVRLFNETKEALEQQTATSEILRVISSSPTDLQPVMDAVAESAARLCEADAVIFRRDGDLFERVANFGSTPTGRLGERLRLTRGHVGGRAIMDGTPLQVPDIQAAQDEFPDAFAVRTRAPLRTILAVPLMREGMATGVIVARRLEVRPFSLKQVELLKTFADQAVIAIENARLFLEIEDKSRQLEAASRHKSEFLANMSHELRTPLNAIIGFSEVLTERMFGELNEKQDEYLKDIYASGQHLLSLINDILDLSKIEAGRMELEATDFDLPSAIDNALILVRERATRRGITLGHSVDKRLGTLRGDERKVKQVLLNLLSNALKFTPEGGRIGVSARVHDEVTEVSVTDTGVGIAPEDQEAVFEEFRQVGTADKKVEGTGLGLALSRKFIELHGGRIWVKSQVGHGSTFTFTLPVHRGG